MPRTKIICTLGPASGNETMLRKMMNAGMDIVRLNCSHGTHESLSEYISIVHKLNRNYRRKIRILLDLEGFRIRIGKLKDKTLELKRGQSVILTNDLKKTGTAIPFDYQGLISDIKEGLMIFIDDGNIALEVTKVSKNSLSAKVTDGGTLKEHKGVNIPGARLKFESLTEKDKKDLVFAIENKIDCIAQSFVRNASDMVNIRKFINERDFNCPLIAKIENRSGIANIDKIMEASEGIMIARGDMGVSLPIWEVPLVQKSIIAKCKNQKKLSITATQMLESMTENLRPTRAEVSDVANAVLDGSDCVMLSGESAIGKHPALTVKMMNSIIKHTESFGR